MYIRPRLILHIILFTILAAPLAARGATAPTTRAETRGSFHITFTEASPLSPIDAQNKRHHIKVEPDEHYKLADESFEAYVPADYDPAQAFGLLVWINAADRGSIPKDWQPILDAHHLIGIGANNAGNRRLVGVRFGLALDAVYNLEKTYNIDEARVYVTGVSGGGKVASMLPVIYPEVFTGAIPIVGVGYFRHIPITGQPTKLWQATFEKPPTAVFERARTMSRLVLVTGSGDFNRDSIKDIFEKGFKADRFEHVEYVEVPGMGHGLADAQTMEHAIDSLDAPLPQIREQLAKLDKARRPPGLPGPPVASQIHPPVTQPLASDESEAQGLLSLAETYERNKLYDQARQRLEKILHDYPATPAADKARQMLKRIEAEATAH